MLRTSLVDLKEIHKKEELEAKFSSKLENTALIPKIKSDYLPYGNFVRKIASTLENSPPKPFFNLRMENEYNFKKI